MEGALPRNSTVQRPLTMVVKLTVIACHAGGLKPGNVCERAAKQASFRIEAEMWWCQKMGPILDPGPGALAAASAAV